MSALLPAAAEIDVAAALAHWRENGFARLGQVIAPSTLRELRERADDLMLGKRTIEGLFFQHDAETGRYEDLPYGEGWVGPSLRYRKIEKLERDEAYRGLIENALFERVVRAVIPGDVTIYRAVLFGKAPRTASTIPWHQDGGRFWGVDRNPELQIWTALDDAPLGGGCLEVLPKSHLAGLATPNGGVVPASFVERDRADERAVKLPAVAGEAILLHNMLWHRSGSNDGDGPRRAFTVCYMPADTKCLRTKRAPRQFVGVFAGQRGE